MTDTEKQEHEWYLDENTPGTGPRPDWLPPKYKRVSDLAKSYEEAERRLGGFTGAPERYDISGLEIDENSHVVKELMAVGQELNMNQDALQKVMGRLQSAYEIEADKYIENEVKKLGTDGERLLNEFNNWTNKYLPPEEREIIRDSINTAESLKTFSRIIAHTRMDNVPTEQTMSWSNNFESVSDLKAELAKNLERYKNDKDYRAGYTERLSQAVQRGK